MDDQRKKELLNIAKETAILAGQLLKKADPSIRKINKDMFRDVKIEADTRSEKIIIAALEEKTDLSILSEEKGFVERENKEYCWIVDPVDGSLNYSQGLPMCCVSIGLWQGDSPILGLVYDFNREEMFSGIVGVGAWLNDRPITVSDTAEENKAVVFSGFPVKMDFSDASIRDFIHSVQEYRKVRLIGAAALSLAYVGAGRGDAYYEKDILLWDIAGGVPVVLGAGGAMQIEKGSQEYSYHVFISNGRLKK